MSEFVYECARKYVSKAAAAESGKNGHDATFSVACVLIKGFDFSIDEARPIMLEYNARCLPPWSDREIEHKLKQADSVGDDQRRGWLRPAQETTGGHGPREALPASRAASAPLPVKAPVKPTFQEDKLKAFACRWRPFVDTVWLAERSAIVPFTMKGMVTAAEYLRAIFREGEKVVVFTNQQSQGQAMWPLQELPTGGDEGVWYLAQPVDGLEHENPRVTKNEDGSTKMSRRSAESVTDWRHLVLESDKADARDWMGALVQLPLRILAIYTSGGRSIHALVRVDAPTEQEWNNLVKTIRPMLVTLGADPKAMSAVRLTRLPGCMRGDKLQKLLYLNPGAAASPICTLSRRCAILDDWVKLAKDMMGMTTEAVREQEFWGTAERTLEGLRWYSQNATARELVGPFEAWMGGAE